MMSTAVNASRLQVADHRRGSIDPDFVVCRPNGPSISRLGTTAPYSVLPTSSLSSSPFDIHHGRLAHNASSTPGDSRWDPTHLASAAPRGQMNTRWLPAAEFTERPKQRENELQRPQREFAENQRQHAATERAEQQRRKELEELAKIQHRKEVESCQNEEEINQQWLLNQREARQRKEEELRVKEGVLCTAEEELRVALKELRVREEELQVKMEELREKEKESQAKGEELQKKEEWLQAEEEEIRAKEEELQAKEKESQVKGNEFREKEKELERRRCDSRRREEELTHQEEEENMRLEEEQRNEEGEPLEERLRHEGYERKRAEGGEIREGETEEKETRGKKRRKMDLQGEEKQEEDYDYAEELRQQQEFSRRYGQLDEAQSRETSWFFSNPVPNSSPPASGASSVHSQWSSNTRRSSASSASSPVSDSTRTPWGARPSPTISVGLGDNRPPTIGISQSSTSVWTMTNSIGVRAGDSPAYGSSDSRVHNYARSEAEWYRLQEEYAYKQREQFKQDSMRAVWVPRTLH